MKWNAWIIGLASMLLAVAPLAPAYAAQDRLAELEEAADALILSNNENAEARGAIVAALEAVIAEAESLPLADGSPNPAIGRAQIKLASQLYAGGGYESALALVEEGLGRIADHLDSYALGHAEGVALRGVILAHLGRAADAQAALLEGYEQFGGWYDTLPPADRTRGPTVAKSNLEFALSQSSGRLGEADAALEWQRRSLETRRAVLGDMDADTIGARYQLALSLNRVARSEEAEAEAREAAALAIAHLPESHSVYARSLEALGIVLSRTGRPVEATDFLLRAIDLKRRHEGGDSLFFGYALHNLGTIFLQRERYEDALPLLEEAAPIFARFQGEDSPFAIGSRARIGQVHYANSDLASALSVLEPLERQLASQSIDSENATRIRPDLVRALAETGRAEDAESLALAHRDAIAASGESDSILRATARLLAARYASSQTADLAAATDDLLAAVMRRADPDVKRSPGGSLRSALDLAMDSAVVLQDPQAMIAAMALAGGSDLAAASRMRAERLAAGNPAMAAAMRDVQDRMVRADEAYRAWLAALSVGAGIEESRDNYDLATAESRAANDAFAAAFDDAAGLLAPAVPDFVDLVGSLAPTEGLLAVLPAYSGTYILAAAGDEVVLRRSSLGRAETDRLARRVTTGLAAGLQDRAASRALAAGLLPPEIMAVFGQRSSLKVFTTGPLASVPFAALDLSAGVGEPAWLADRFAISSFGTLDGRSPAPRTGGTASGGRLVAFADPASFAQQEAPPTTDAPRGTSAFFTRTGIDRTALATLPPLPGTRREAEAVASSWPGTERIVLEGSRASESAVKSPIVAKADLLLFAVHGLVAGELEGIAEPALIMAAEDAGGAEDGVLLASEIATLDLEADWVILSSCNSLAGLDGGPTAFSGLASAFRYAGAGSLLATHWKIRDDIAALLTAETIRAYRAGASKPEALRRGQQAVRASGLPDAGQPWNWAAFVLIE